MSRSRLHPAARLPGFALLCLLAGCGGGGSGGPSGPSTPPTGTPTPGATVEVVVFFDEDGDGLLDSLEGARVPNVQVSLGGRSAVSVAGSGVATITGVAPGTHTLSVGGMPPFYRAAGAISVGVPAGGRVNLPLTLPIGSGVDRNVYMAFGDSITLGLGAPPSAAYPMTIEGQLREHFSAARVSNRGDDGTDTFQAIIRIVRNLRGSNPSQTLILYGTNDWNHPDCKVAAPCHTVKNLRVVVKETVAWGSLPFIATIPPSNPALEAPPRNAFYEAVNKDIAVMAAEEGAFLVDLYGAFVQHGNLPSLFSDHVHPNAAGNALIAQTFFEAIAFGRATPASAGTTAVPTFGWGFEAPAAGW